MQLRTLLRSRYGIQPADVRIVRSPYRICPLGAHIDHQLGPVTAMAIDRAVHLAFAPSGSAEVRLSSLSFDGEVRFDVGDVPPRSDEDWGNYARGAVAALKQSHPVTQGIVGITEGRHADGGLSSSAAIGVAYLLALEDANGLVVTPRENIELDRLIENEYLGLRNGILDQSAILLSRRDHLTLIDCKTVSHELVPRADAMPPFKILVAASGIRQALVATGYNTRVDECASAARKLLEAVGRPDAQPLLGNLTATEYAEHKDLLEHDEAKRARHFFAEAQRVMRGVDAWKRGDLDEFGALVSQSGRSSIENYECGSPPLIDLYEMLVETDGVYGARFSGAGFRGCCVALVKPEAAEAAAERIRRLYPEKHPDLAEGASVALCEPADGAAIL